MADLAPCRRGGRDAGGKGAPKYSISVPLAMWEMNQNDTRRDTGSKLCRFGMAQRLTIREHWGGIILSPAATRTVSRDDRELIARYGVGVVNCSWAKLDDVPFHKLKSGGDRLLPYMFAANPTKYGQPCTLSSCEALAAALHIAGFARDARLVMAKFKWGESFYQLNGEYLDRYAACADSAAVIRVQKEIIAMIEKEKVEARAAKAADSANDYGGNFGIESSEEEEEYEDDPAAAQPEPEQAGALPQCHSHGLSPGLPPSWSGLAFSRQARSGWGSSQRRRRSGWPACSS